VYLLTLWRRQVFADEHGGASAAESDAQDAAAESVHDARARRAAAAQPAPVSVPAQRGLHSACTVPHVRRTL